MPRYLRYLRIALSSVDTNGRSSVLRQPAFWIGLVLILLPFALYYPYKWWVFDYAQYSIVSEEVSDPRHRAIDLGLWFIVTFGLYLIVSLSLGVPLLVWTVCQPRIGWAAFAVVVAILSATIVWIGILVICFGFEFPRSFALAGAVPAVGIGLLVLCALVLVNPSSG
jgi:hypothetical protein